MNDISMPGGRVKLWIGGESRAAHSGAIYLDNNPEDDRPFAEAARAGVDDVNAAVEAAHLAFNDYRQVAPRQREAWLMRAAVLLEERSAEFANILVQEIGSPMNKARFELQYAIAHLQAAAGIPRRVIGQTLPSDTPGRFSMAVREPLGVFACITPFNVPLIKIMKQCTGPLATGNTVVTLASEEAPVLSIRLAELLRDAGFPAGAFNVLTGYGYEIGDALVTHPLVKALNFTGSTRVGRHLSELCGLHMKRCLLELGGKNPFVVLKDADLDAAVMGATMGMFLYQGQACMAASRIIVEKPIYEEFMGRFKKAAGGLSFGDLTDPRTIIGPIISPRQRDRVRSHIEDAVAKGATLEVGGQWVGNRCMPTVLSGVKSAMTCYQEETFGPLTSVYEVESADAALALANDNIYGLSASVYTRDLDLAMQFTREIRAGMVHVNAPTLYDEPHAPFGGVGESGMGREGVIMDIDHCTEWKWITVQSGASSHGH